MALPLAGDGVANKTDDGDERNPEQQQQLERRKLQPRQPGPPREHNTHHADQDQRADPLPPAPWEEKVLRFLPDHGPEVAHLASSSIRVRKTSSRLARPRRTSSISPPACTIKLT